MSEYKERRLISGAYGIILTPFLSTGEVDYAELERRVDEVCNTPIHGLVACGSTGEFTYLSLEETKKMILFVKNVIAGRKQYVCGTTAASCHAALELLAYAESIGADAALVAPPYYFPMGDDDVRDFYQSLNDAPGKLPVVAYQIPQCTSGISMNVFKALLKMPRIKGIKNSSGNGLQIMQQIALRNDTRSDFSVLTGSDETIYPLVNSGADGSFTALGYICPELISMLYQHLDNELGLKYQMKVVKLAAAAGAIPYPLGYKLLGEATGNMKFGTYLQAVSPCRMEKYEQEKLAMQSILNDNI